MDEHLRYGPDRRLTVLAAPAAIIAGLSAASGVDPDEKLRQHRIGRHRDTVERMMWEDVVRYWAKTRVQLWAAANAA